jgi:hypothetical protein
MSRNQQQWIVRYRGHKRRKLRNDWIEQVTWDKRAAEVSAIELRQHWNEVEVAPFIDPIRRKQMQSDERGERRSNRGDE